MLSGNYSLPIPPEDSGSGGIGITGYYLRKSWRLDISIEDK